MQTISGRNTTRNFDTNVVSARKLNVVCAFKRSFNFKHSVLFLIIGKNRKLAKFMEKRFKKKSILFLVII